MANLIDGDRWVFTSTTSAAEEKKLGGFHKILGIFWTSDETTGKDIAADDDMYLMDGNNLKIISKRAVSAGDDVGITIGYPGLPVTGFKVRDLDGGTLTIWRALPYIA